MLPYKIISYIFHPVLFATFAALIYFKLIPSHIPIESKRVIVGIVFATTCIIPTLLLSFLKRFQLIENYHLHSIEERKFPVLFMALLFGLLGRLLLNANTGTINLLAFSFFGCSLALLFVYILFPLRIKASLHCLSIGGLIGLILLMSYQYEQNYLFFTIILFITFGIIATARLKLKAHTDLEVYLGLVTGIVSQLVLYAFYLRFNYNI